MLSSVLWETSSRGWVAREGPTLLSEMMGGEEPSFGGGGGRGSSKVEGQVAEQDWLWPQQHLSIQATGTRAWEIGYVSWQRTSNRSVQVAPLCSLIKHTRTPSKPPARRESLAAPCENALGNPRTACARTARPVLLSPCRPC